MEISSLNLKLVTFILNWIFAAMDLDGRNSQKTGYTTLITLDGKSLGKSHRHLVAQRMGVPALNVTLFEHIWISFLPTKFLLHGDDNNKTYHRPSDW